MMKNYFNLPSGIVVQRSTISHMVGTDMTETINRLIASGKTVRVVESTSEFFNDANFFAAVDAGDVASLQLIAEQRKIFLTDDDLDNIRQFVAFKSVLKQMLDAARPPYEFAELPADWKFDQNIRITAKGVYRAGNSDYKISLATLERIWKQASRVWAKLDNNKNVGEIRAAGYNRTGMVRDNRIEIGCQTIYRYELEQLAVQQGWPLPEKVEAAQE